MLNSVRIEVYSLISVFARMKVPKQR